MFNERKTESALLHLYLSAGLTQKIGKNDFHFAFVLTVTAHMCCGITLESRKKLIYCILKFNPCLPEDNKERKLRSEWRFSWLTVSTCHGASFWRNVLFYPG